MSIETYIYAEVRRDGIWHPSPDCIPVRVLGKTKIRVAQGGRIELRPVEQGKRTSNVVVI